MTTPDTNTKPTRKHYIMPQEQLEWAQRESERRCRETGKPVEWYQVVREVLDKHLKDAGK